MNDVSSIRHVQHGVEKVGKTLGNIARFIGEGGVMDLTVGLILGEAMLILIHSIVTDLISPIIVMSFGRNSRQLENMFVYLLVPAICIESAIEYNEQECQALNTPQLAQGIL